MTLLPRGKVRQQFLDVFLIADEVVVDDEDGPSPSSVAQRVQLYQHLLVALSSRHSSVDLDDVAELAIEGAAARILDRHRAVASHVGELEVRNRSQRHCRTLGRLIYRLGFAALQVANDSR